MRVRVMALCLLAFGFLGAEMVRADPKPPPDEQRERFRKEMWRLEDLYERQKSDNPNNWPVFSQAKGNLIWTEKYHSQGVTLIDKDKDAASRIAKLKQLVDDVSGDGDYPEPKDARKAVRAFLEAEAKRLHP